MTTMSVHSLVTDKRDALLVEGCFFQPRLKTSETLWSFFSYAISWSACLSYRWGIHSSANFRERRGSFRDRREWKA